MGRSRITVLLLACALCVMGRSDAYAHAFLDHTLPPVGSTVRSAPAELVLWFTEQLEPSFCQVEVTDAAGSRVDRGDLKPDPQNAEVLHLALKPLPPGTYTAVWQVVSVDTHRTNGHFTFTVAAP